jgi:hypothetical protein
MRLVVCGALLWLCAAAAGCGGESFQGGEGQAGADAAAGSAGSSGHDAGGASGSDASTDADGSAGTTLDGGDASDGEVKCTAEQKLCAAKCVPLTSPEYGCAAASCDPCHIQHAVAKCSTNGSCMLDSCETGYANCDDVGSNGCEIHLLSNIDHCSGCGKKCIVAAGTPACTGGVCGVSKCETGKGDCDQQLDNGCETDTTQSLEHCGGCGNACDVPHATPACQASACKVATCNSGWADCNGEADDGCEANTNESVAHCGGCDTKCPDPPNGSAACENGTCGVGCAANFGNCDGDPNNGCETELLGSEEHCGACGMACSPANGTGQCTGGVCAITGCAAGFDDCDGVVANGCEVNLLADVTNCGGCGTACTTPKNSTPTCNGTCGYTCNTPFLNCDSDPDCEVNSSINVANCGACNNVCSLPNASAACTNGTCQIDQCVNGWTDCDNAPANGCDVYTAGDTQNCGTCGKICTFVNASAQCVNGGCQLGTCNAGFGDCNGIAADGCETNLKASAEHCNACGALCAPMNAHPSCDNGICKIASCVAGYGNCDLDDSTGCEVDLANNPLHCNSCNNKCVFTNAASICNLSLCMMGPCQAGWDNCNGTIGDGCEVNLNSSATDCGGCSQACSTPNGKPACSSGTCTTGSCNTGWGDCDGVVANGCEVNLMTSANDCGVCGRSCLGATCSAGKCNPIQIATVVNPLSLATNGTRVYVVSQLDAAGRIISVLVGGGGLIEHATNQDRPDGLAINSTRVYWTTFNTRHVRWAPLTEAGNNLAYTAPNGNLGGLAATDSHLAFVNWTNGTVYRCPIGDCASPATYAGAANSNPHRIALNSSGLFWANWNNDNVKKSPLSTWTVTDVAAGQDGALGVALDGEFVYWTSQFSGSVTRAPLTGGASTTLAAGQQKPTGIAVDSTHVYWTNVDGGAIRRVPKTGGGVEDVATGQTSPNYVALDAVAVYWTDYVAGAVRRVAK